MDVKFSLSLEEKANLPLPMSIYKTLLNEAGHEAKGLSFSFKERWHAY